MREILKLVNVKKNYFVKSGVFKKPVIAQSLTDVNFPVFSGKTLSIVEESGCGKTTTTRLILHLEKPTEGKIYYKDKDINLFNHAQVREYRRKIQAVFQDPYTFLTPHIKIGSIVSH